MTNRAVYNVIEKCLVGKAPEVYSGLPVERCADYDVVKTQFLKRMSLFLRLIDRNLDRLKKMEFENNMGMYCHFIYFLFNNFII